MILEWVRCILLSVEVLRLFWAKVALLLPT